jgi:uncharacterized protein (TIGR00255 family)
MIYSMTAFARGECQGEQGSLICEVRSVNHRYIEINMHLPESLRAFEIPMREQVRKQLNRGKIECVLRYQASVSAEAGLCKVNMSLARGLCQAAEQIAALSPQSASISPTDILRFPGVLQVNEIDLKQIQPELLQLLNQILTDLIAARAREGEELKQLLLQRIHSLQFALKQAKDHLPQVLKDQQERLVKRFTEAKIDLDAIRLEQEMMFFAQKIDVAEEMERIAMHLQEAIRILEEGGVVGRRLDFLLQELNREANTLGSKSPDPLLSHLSVEMKVLIEQMREQVQNIE